MVSAIWMERMRLAFLSILFGVTVFYAGGSFAQEMPTSRRFDFSAAFRYTPLIGNEQPRVKWSDIYDDGLGGSFEVGYRGIPHLTVHGGAAYDIFRGKNVSFFLPSGRLSGKFSDQELLSLYAGVKGYLLHTPAPQQSYGVNPYLRFDLGTTFFKDVALGRTELARSGPVLAGGVGAGVDILFSTDVVLFFEGKYQIFGQPDGGETFRGLPLSAGLRYLL